MQGQADLQHRLRRYVQPYDSQGVRDRWLKGDGWTDGEVQWKRKTAIWRNTELMYEDADENTKLTDCYYEKKDWRLCKDEVSVEVVVLESGLKCAD